MHKKRPKIFTHYGVSEAKIYLYHSSENTNSRPLLGLSSEYNSVQSFSGSWPIRPEILWNTFLTKVDLMSASYFYRVEEYFLATTYFVHTVL